MQKTKLTKDGIVSLQSISGGMAGDDRFLHRFNMGKKCIAMLGLKPVESVHSLKGIKYISENPNKRAEDLMNAIRDKQVIGIFANIGGIDSHKIFDYIDLKEINNNPKLLLGYSDITAVHFMFYKAGVQSFYGPTVLDGFAENVKMHKLTRQSMQKALFSGEEQVITSSNEWTSEFLDWADEKNDKISRKMHQEKYGFITLNGQNQISGHLIGGCLDTIIQIREYSFFPSLNEWEGSIMFLETSGQKMKPKEFEEALTLLKEEIEVCNGIIFGKPKDETYFKEYLEIIKRVIIKPIFYNINFGHTAPLITIAYGGSCVLDFKNKLIRIKP